MARSGFELAMLGAIFLTGFLSFAYELALHGAAVTVVGSGQVAMAIVISMFILGYMTGRPIGALSDRLSLRSNLLLFAGLELCVAVMMLAVLPLVRASPYLADVLEQVWPLGILSEYERILLVLSGAALAAPLLMGGEIPLAVKALTQHAETTRADPRDASSRIGTTAGRVWAADAFGAALGGLAAALVILPALGREATMVLLAVLAVVAAVLPLLALRLRPGPAPRARRRSSTVRRWVAPGFALLLIASGALTLVGVATGDELRYQYEGHVIHAETSLYQEIVVTDRTGLGRTLWLDGQLQTSERDEHQYHEPLTLLALGAHESPRVVAVIGGGDGGALRNLLRDTRVEQATLVELDRRVVAVSREHLPSVSASAFDDPRAHLIHGDGWAWLRDAPAASLDVLILDLPDPTQEAVALLYTREFYETAHAALAPGGILVTQAGSPFETPHLTASLRATVGAVFGPSAVDVHESLVWSYGEWAFVTARKEGPGIATTDRAQVEAAFRALDPTPEWYRPARFAALLALGDDDRIDAADARISTLDRPLLVNAWYQSPTDDGAFSRLPRAWPILAAPVLALAAGALLVRRARREVIPVVP